MTTAINHKNRGHALLGPSSAHRWMACTPSARIEEGLTSNTSKFAQEGTYAHEFAERYANKMLGRKVPRDTTSKKALAENFDVDEMKEHAEAYADYIQGKLTSNLNFVIVEEQVDFSKYVPDGFGTADCIIYDEKTLTLRVIDFKYGKGVEVLAEHNEQMMLYAIGAYEEYGFIFDIKNIEMCIFQPRKNNISEWTISVDELLKWAEKEAKPKAQLAFEGKGELVAGEHCRFCKAKARCKALMEMTEEVMDCGFEDITKESANDVNTLSDEQISLILSKIKVIQFWLDAVESYALGQALNGHDIPNYKVVEGRANRKYISEEKVAEFLRSKGLADEQIYKTTLRGITDVEKLLGKGKKELAPYLEKPRGKPVLALLSDKRDVYKPEEIFEVIEEGDE